MTFLFDGASCSVALTHICRHARRPCSSLRLGMLQEAMNEEARAEIMRDAVLMAVREFGVTAAQARQAEKEHVGRDELGGVLRQVLTDVQEQDTRVRAALEGWRREHVALHQCHVRAALEGWRWEHVALHQCLEQNQAGPEGASVAGTGHVGDQLGASGSNGTRSDIIEGGVGHSDGWSEGPEHFQDALGEDFEPDSDDDVFGMLDGLANPDPENPNPDPDEIDDFVQAAWLPPENLNPIPEEIDDFAQEAAGAGQATAAGTLGASARTVRLAVLLAVRALGVNAERKARAEKGRDEFDKLFQVLMSTLTDDQQGDATVLALRQRKGTAVVQLVATLTEEQKIRALVNCIYPDDS